MVEVRNPDGDAMIMAAALFEIAHTSGDAEIVRQALGTLTNTESGQAYLEERPFQL